MPDEPRSVLGPVRIMAADESWPRLFQAERSALLAVRPNPFREIEHFGSTAVPGLAAKPVIDIMAAVAKLADLDAAEPALAVLGYERLDVGFRKRRFYRKPDDGSGAAVNLHAVTADRWSHKSERLFRDWLMARPDAAQAYATLKAELASRFPDDAPAYTAAKSEFIRRIVNAARQRLGLPQETDWDE
jgi:GrpB-like predicted nucleotidyltransferase (UPF0157 family)